MGEVFLFCSVRAFVHKRGKEDHGHGHGTGTTRRARAEIPTAHLLCAAAKS